MGWAFVIVVRQCGELWHMGRILLGTVGGRMSRLRCDNLLRQLPFSVHIGLVALLYRDSAFYCLRVGQNRFCCRERIRRMATLACLNQPTALFP